MATRGEIDRFWDVYLTTDDGTTDYAEMVDLNKVHRTEVKRRAGLKSLMLVERVLYSSRLVAKPATISESPWTNLGYVASMVTMSELQGANSDETAQKLVAWVNDINFRGKLRFSSHGTLEGGFTPTANEPSIESRLFGEWLTRNGLAQAGQRNPKPTGLITIAVNACYSARYNLFAAQANNPNLNGSLAKRSAIGQIVLALRKGNVIGVRVTGTNECTVRSGKFLTRGVGMPQGEGWGNFVQETRGEDVDGKKLFDYKVTVPKSSTPKSITPPFSFHEGFMEFDPSMVTVSEGFIDPLAMGSGWRLHHSGPGGFWQFLRGSNSLFTLSDFSGWRVDVKKSLLDYPTGWTYDGIENALITKGVSELDKLEHAEIGQETHRQQKLARSGAKIAITS